MSQKLPNHLNLFQVNTTAYDEEDFLLLTTLTEKQILDVIEPIVKDERENEVEYDNAMLLKAIKKTYPSAVAMMYDPSDIEIISV